MFHTRHVFLLALLPASIWAAPSPLVFQGMCDASAAVALDAQHFAVANDEDNILRIFNAQRGGPPIQTWDASPFLAVEARWPEADLEGACWLGDRVYWITSHARNKDGKMRSSRYRFFATRITRTNGRFEFSPVGKPYTRLLEDLLAEPRLEPFHLRAASQKPPKTPDALNIEGLCATPAGHLLIGFRNPIPEGKALLLPLLNPADIITGQRARFGEPRQLDLGGHGIRDIATWQNRFVLVAGSFDAEGRSRLFTWNGEDARPEPLADPGFERFNPEALIAYPEPGDRLQILSDDGTVKIGGVPCKELKVVLQRQFRGVWFEPLSR